MYICNTEGGGGAFHTSIHTPIPTTGPITRGLGIILETTGESSAEAVGTAKAIEPQAIQRKECKVVHRPSLQMPQLNYSQLL